MSQSIRLFPSSARPRSGCDSSQPDRVSSVFAAFSRTEGPRKRITGIHFFARRSCGKTAAVAALAFAAGAYSGATQAYPIGPFAIFAGSFRGSGVVIGSNGYRERISCRARDEVGDGGRGLSQSIVCASASYRFDIHSRAVAEGSSVRGEWQETTRGVSGSLSGRIYDGRFSGVVNGGSFAASVSLRASKGSLSMTLAPNGGDVARVDITMRR